MAGDPTSLKDYLNNKYRIDDDMENKRKKKMNARPGVIVVDEDPIWQKPVKPEDGEEKYTDDFKHKKSGRAENQISDISPPRRRRRRNDSPPCSDLSPHRRSINNSGDRDAAEPTISDLSRPKSGLISLQDFKSEIDRERKEDWIRFNEMDISVSGRGAEPIYRNKLTLERISKEEFLESRKKKLNKFEKPKERKVEWGKGLAQKRNFEARMQEIEDEKDRPFSRSRDDPDLNAMLKERVRWGDPMGHLIKKKRLELILRDIGDSKEMRESGFIIPQDIPTHSWMRRGLDVAPNRYGINPGRHWDGADRSNGYEKELFKRMNGEKATGNEAYMWSVSDICLPVEFGLERMKEEAFCNPIGLFDDDNRHDDVRMMR